VYRQVVDGPTLEASTSVQAADAHHTEVIGKCTEHVTAHVPMTYLYTVTTAEAQSAQCDIIFKQGEIW